MKQLLVFIPYHIFRILDKAYHSYLYARLKKRYKVHADFLFNGRNIKLLGEGSIELGANSYIGDNSTLSVDKGYKIVVGENCKMSNSIKIYSNSFIADQDFSAAVLKEKNGDIIIGNYVWIGANVFINPGVVIGDNAVIGANSVVSKDVPAFAIAAGVPATVLRQKNIIQ
ncbi:MAG: maltose O-acetyltransferase [Chitinophagaceae bacterium]|nr:maltose O-acetyltransferase [Chitinophagaceae bacterium]